MAAMNESKRKEILQNAIEVTDNDGAKNLSQSHNIDIKDLKTKSEKITKFLEVHKPAPGDLKLLRDIEKYYNNNKDKSAGMIDKNDINKWEEKLKKAETFIDTVKKAVAERDRLMRQDGQSIRSLKKSQDNRTARTDIDPQTGNESLLITGIGKFGDTALGEFLQDNLEKIGDKMDFGKILALIYTWYQKRKHIDKQFEKETTNNFIKCWNEKKPDDQLALVRIANEKDPEYGHFRLIAKDSQGKLKDLPQNLHKEILEEMNHWTAKSNNQTVNNIKINLEEDNTLSVDKSKDKESNLKNNASISVVKPHNKAFTPTGQAVGLKENLPPPTSTPNS